MSGDGTAVVLDATVLSNFASSDAVDWLVDECETLYTVPAVRNELIDGTEAGHEFLKPARRALDSGAIETMEFDSDLESPFSAETDRLDAGEFEALMLAVEKEWTLATDDGAARRAANSAGINVTGSVGLLVRGVDGGDLSVQSANEWLTVWIEDRGYYAPIDRVEEVLPDDS